MGRSSAAVWLVTLLLFSFLPSMHHPSVETLGDSVDAHRSGASGLNIAFSNGPAQDDDIKGTRSPSALVGPVRWLRCSSKSPAMNRPGPHW